MKNISVVLDVGLQRIWFWPSSRLFLSQVGHYTHCLNHWAHLILRYWPCRSATNRTGWPCWHFWAVSPPPQVCCWWHPLPSRSCSAMTWSCPHYGALRLFPDKTSNFPECWNWHDASVLSAWCHWVFYSSISSMTLTSSRFLAYWHLVPLHSSRQPWLVVFTGVAQAVRACMQACWSALPCGATPCFSQRCCAACLSIIRLLPNICCCLAHLTSTPCVQKRCSALSPLRLWPTGCCGLWGWTWFHISGSRACIAQALLNRFRLKAFFTMKASLCHPLSQIPTWPTYTKMGHGLKWVTCWLWQNGLRVTDQPYRRSSNSVSKIMSYSMKTMSPMACGGVLLNSIWRELLARPLPVPYSRLPWSITDWLWGR